MQLQYVYSARVLRVIDGDTMDLLVDLGFRNYTKQRVRLLGINTPEKYGVKRDSPEWAAGQAATNGVHDWLSHNALYDMDGTIDKIYVIIKSHDGKPLGQGKYGRWLVEVFPWAGPGHYSPEAEVQSLNTWLVNENLAEKVEY